MPQKAQPSQRYNLLAITIGCLFFPTGNHPIVLPCIKVAAALGFFSATLMTPFLHTPLAHLASLTNGPNKAGCLPYSHCGRFPGSGQGASLMNCVGGHVYGNVPVTHLHCRSKNL